MTPFKMPTADKYLADFREEQVYHVYNRTNNRELLFRCDANYLFFLAQFDKYISPFADLYCWSLLPNHFHFMIRIKNAAQIKAWLLQKSDLKGYEKKYLNGKQSTSKLIEQSFRRLFISYSMAYNKKYERTGNLFQRRFSRIAIETPLQFLRTVIYIHTNPANHKLVTDFREYKWSSWKTLTDDHYRSRFQHRELIKRFGTKEKFINAHFGLASYAFFQDSPWTH